jgi:hypothetical protein
LLPISWILAFSLIGDSAATGLATDADDASSAFLAASHWSSNDEVTVTGVRGA